MGFGAAGGGGLRGGGSGRGTVTPQRRPQQGGGGGYGAGAQAGAFAMPGRGGFGAGGGGGGGYEGAGPNLSTGNRGRGGGGFRGGGQTGGNMSTGKYGGGGPQIGAGRPAPTAYGGGNDASAGEQGQAFTASQTGEFQVPQGYTEILPGPAYNQAKQDMARNAMAQGQSKSEYMNQMYGTGFFKDEAGQNAQQSWGSDWY